MIKFFRGLMAIAITLPLAWPALAAQSEEERRLNELRNTVVNLLQTLVQKGVLTREQAEAMVKSAQDKAVADAAAVEQQEKAREKEEAGAVRVPYVPEVVKKEIRKEVADQLAPEVTQQVLSEAKSQAWGIPGALPDWIKRITFSGDIRVRSEGDVYPSGNAQNAYLNFNAINSAGGFGKAGAAALLNTSIDRYYLLARLRLDMNAVLGSGWSVGSRLGTGNLVNPDSLNQVLGQYGGRYQTDIDLAYLRWMGGVGRHHLMAEGGKFPNPWLSSDLVWDTDVTFEGVAASYKLGLAPDAAKPYYWFLTLGAIPVQEIALSSNDKWLYAGQTGIDFQASQGSRFRLGAAYYYFKNVAGQRNAPESNLLDYTAPPYVQKGNTMFDIRNTQDTTQGLNLFALAADFHELDVMAAADFMLSPRYRLSVYADYVKNIGYNENAIFARTGALVPPRTKGYQAEVSFGRPTLERAGAWRTFIGYRYLQRDAVVDAFTDQDYHLGGTDAQGYFVGADVGLTSRVWMRARYLPFNSIDEPQLNINVWQVEVNARF